MDGPDPLITTTFGFRWWPSASPAGVRGAQRRRCLLNRVRVPGAASLALWSYAVYLVHKPVFMALRPQLERLRHRRQCAPGGLAVMALGVAGGWLLYRLVETAVHAAARTLVPDAIIHADGYCFHFHPVYSSR
jgi:peptidoglycan/LPS O-acetylase OafA/YrhL